MGLAGYYLHLIGGFADNSSTLHVGTSGKNNYVYNEDREDKFIDRKNVLVRPPALAYPNFNMPFLVETDSPAFSIGEILTLKKEDGKYHSIQFASKTMIESKISYALYESEALAVIFSSKNFRIYLLSSHRFKFMSDSKDLN